MVSRLSFQPPGVGKRLGGYRAHLADIDHRNISYIPMILCSAKKAEGKEEKVGLLVIILASLAHAHNMY